MNSEGKRKSSKQKVGRPKLPKEQRMGQITPVRLNTEERALFQKKADKQGLKLSDWIRRVLREAAG